MGEQLLAHDHAPEIGDHNGGEEGNDDPDDGHDRGLLDHRGLLDGHEAHEDVRHTEVAKTPTEAADDVLPARVEDTAAEGALRHRAGRSVGILIDRLQRRGIKQLAVAEIDDDRHQHQRRHHQKALEEIRPAHGGEAAEEGVGHDDEQEGEHGDLRGNIREERGKHGGARHQRGGHIDRVGKEEDERAHELQRAGIDREAVRQVLRERDGIVRRLGEGAKALGAQDPVGRRTDGKADADPHLAEAEGEDRAGQAHQQPRGHIGRLRGQGGDPGAHGASAEEEVLRIFVRAVEVEHQRHAEQDNKVRDKCCDLPVHKLLSFRLSV